MALQETKDFLFCVDSGGCAMRGNPGGSSERPLWKS